MEEFKEKPLDEYTEEDMKKMFLDMFFYVAENRPEWLQEAIEMKKAKLKEYAQEAKKLRGP